MTDSIVPPECARDHYGTIGQLPVEAVTIKNTRGLTARVISYGARLVEFWAPDRDGHFADLVLGWDTLGDYVANRGCFGATCGRFANRIAGGRFSLDGRDFQITTNEGGNALHGGPQGFDKCVWEIKASDDDVVVFALTSADGDMGFPGKLHAEVAYRITEDDTLEIAFSAETDAPTVVNIVNHAYWNMAGHDSGDTLGQMLKINARSYLPVDAGKIPTGEVAPVAGTPFDFREAKPIGRDIADTPLGYYDNNFCLDGERGTLREALVMSDPASGRRMTLATTEAGVQVYTAGHLDGSQRGKGGAPYPKAAGVAIETQTWPDAPNWPDFPSARLDPGQSYDHRMAFRFTTDAS
ncbi:MAG: galactose mutarotase [Rhodobiaceae bacterium]|nr:galactose mutarotase [Rhodobiaceae bacterium]